MASAYSTLEESEQKGLNRFFSKAFWRNTAYAGVGVVIISIIAAIVLILVLSMFLFFFSLISYIGSTCIKESQPHMFVVMNH